MAAGQCAGQLATENWSGMASFDLTGVPSCRAGLNFHFEIAFNAAWSNPGLDDFYTAGSTTLPFSSTEKTTVTTPAIPSLFIS